MTKNSKASKSQNQNMKGVVLVVEGSDEDGDEGDDEGGGNGDDEGSAEGGGEDGDEVEGCESYVGGDCGIR